MVLRFFLFAAVFIFMSCSDVKFNNPDDERSENYQVSSSSVAQSSSSKTEEYSSSSSKPSSSSSSARLSSSSSKPSSSSSLAYTLTCSDISATITEGTPISQPKVTCNGTAVPDDVPIWMNEPDWDYPTAGTYSISVMADYGACKGKTASCGTLTVATPPPSSSSVAPSSSSGTSSSSSSKPSSSSAPPSSSSVAPSSSSAPVVTSCDMNYRTVVIGTQTWMAENLNCNVSGSKCYGNNESNCATYGRLYDWSTAMNLQSSCNSQSCYSQIGTKHRGICPEGWHIPSNADWNVLMKTVNPSCSDNSYCAGAGTKLKAREGWNSYSGVPAGTDDFGFSALPGGLGSSAGSFNDVGNRGYWWSSSEYDSSDAYRRRMDYYYEDVIYGSNNKDSLFSVRCVQD